MVERSPGALAGGIEAVHIPIVAGLFFAVFALLYVVT